MRKNVLESGSLLDDAEPVSQTDEHNGEEHHEGICHEDQAEASCFVENIGDDVGQRGGHDGAEHGVAAVLRLEPVLVEQFHRHHGEPKSAHVGKTEKDTGQVHHGEHASEERQQQEGGSDDDKEHLDALPGTEPVAYDAVEKLCGEVSDHDGGGETSSHLKGVSQGSAVLRDVRGHLNAFSRHGDGEEDEEVGADLAEGDRAAAQASSFHFVWTGIRGEPTIGNGVDVLRTLLQQQGGCDIEGKRDPSQKDRSRFPTVDGDVSADHRVEQHTEDPAEHGHDPEEGPLLLREPRIDDGCRKQHGEAGPDPG